MLKLGNKDISKFYLGNKGISKAYLGSKLVFENAKPIFIDYIESSGRQWIDTGIATTNNDFGFMLDAMPLTNADVYPIGSRGADNGKRFFGVRSNSSTTFSYGWQWYVTGTASQSYVNVRTTMSLNWLNSKKVTIGNDSKDIAAANIDNGRNITLFGVSGALLWTGRMYRAQISEGDKIIADLRPCLHPKTFEACMYDIISKKYLYNQGTVEFTPAPRFVEYIESTGTQYIDTGIKGTDVTRFVVKGTCVENSVNNTQLLGGTSSSSQTFFGNRYTNNVAKWYCVNSKGTSIGNPHNLSIIDATIESGTSQYGTLTDVVEGTVSEFIKFSGNAWGFSESNLLIFGGYSSRRSPNATCYELQLYTANGLVRHLRPCLKGNTPCMYDMVTKQYFYNQGTGDFIYNSKVIE